jgi:hypothetical protein
MLKADVFLIVPPRRGLSIYFTAYPALRLRIRSPQTGLNNFAPSALYRQQREKPRVSPIATCQNQGKLGAHQKAQTSKIGNFGGENSCFRGLFVL